MITIDTREPTDDIKSMLVMDFFFADHDIEFKALPFGQGDYRLEKKNGEVILIERKTIADFCSSIFNKKSKLKQKLFLMRGNSSRSFLLLEGNYYIDPDNMLIYSDYAPGIKYSTFANYIDHRSDEGTGIIHTQSLAETMKRIVIMHDSDNKIGPACKLQDVSQWLLAIPGIGRKGLDNLKKVHESPISALEEIAMWKEYKMNLNEW